MRMERIFYYNYNNTIRIFLLREVWKRLDFSKFQAILKESSKEAKDILIYFPVVSRFAQFLFTH